MFQGDFDSLPLDMGNPGTAQSRLAHKTGEGQESTNPEAQMSHSCCLYTDQDRAVVNQLGSHYTGAPIEVYKDLAGIPRVLGLYLSE